MQTWEESLDEKLERLIGTVGYFGSDLVLDFIESELERDNPFFDTIGRHAARHASLEDANDEVAKDRLRTLLISKQHDYGHANIMKHHIGGLKVRMWDKCARLRNLSEHRGNSTAVDEPIRETWDDIFGYAVIGMMLLDGTFTLPLRDDLLKAESIPNEVAQLYTAKGDYYALCTEMKRVQLKITRALEALNGQV